jgi:Domain of unknown function (DUF1963)
VLVGESRRVVLDVRSEQQSPVELLGRDAYPRIDITGRVEIDQLKAGRATRVRGPIRPDARDQLLARERARLGEAVGMAGLPFEVIERAMAAVRLRSCIAPSRIPVGASRFSGRPDLPGSYVWPDYDGVPMAFLAQLRCDELAGALPDSDVPRDGMLVVFTAVDGDEGAIFGDAIHVELIQTSALARRPWPRGLPQDARFDHSFVSAEPMLSPPNRWELAERIGDEQADALVDFTRAAGSRHQFLGHLSTVQDVVLTPDERQLLRLDSDPLNGTMDGDGGSLWITIPTLQPFNQALTNAELMIDSQTAAAPDKTPG